MRYFFEVSYKGTHYHGWQRQRNAMSVQQKIEDGLTILLKTPVTIIGSGRTDAGVHCEQQFFHIEAENPLDEGKLLSRLNSILPFDIAIRSIFEVPDDAHARFSAVSRSYEYRITLYKNPFLKEDTYYYSNAAKPLDIDQMNMAAQLLLGKQDFEAFSKVKTEVSNFICDITYAKWRKEGDLIIFDITANRFLRGMVRAIVGTLLDVGTGKRTFADVKKIINEKDRGKAGRSVPACGLFLIDVAYPKWKTKK